MANSSEVLAQKPLHYTQKVQPHKPQLTPPQSPHSHSSAQDREWSRIWQLFFAQEMQGKRQISLVLRSHVGPAMDGLELGLWDKVTKAFGFPPKVL